MARTQAISGNVEFFLGGQYQGSYLCLCALASSRAQVQTWSERIIGKHLHSIIAGISDKLSSSLVELMLINCWYP